MEKVKEKVKDIFPIVTWLPNYKAEYISRDVIAGFTVALTVVPQGLAYAGLAHLPTQYGLYTSYVSAIVYAFMGSSKDLAVGPQSLMSLLTAEYCRRPEGWTKDHLPESEKNSDSEPRLAELLCFGSGLLILLLGVFNLGGVVNFISHPVLVGFISAASVVIPWGLTERVFGLHGLSPAFPKKMWQICVQVTSGMANWVDTLYGFTTLILLVALKHLKIHFSEPQPGDSMPIKIGRKVLWIVATLRNAVLLFITSLMLKAKEEECRFFDEDRSNVTITCLTPTDISAIKLPPFSFPEHDITKVVGNSTEQIGLKEMAGALGSGLLIVPFVAILQSIGIGKSLAERGKYPVCARNDFFAVGIGGIMSSMVKSMPVSGCFSRSSLNFESNAATQMGNIITAVIVMISATVLAPSFVYIPTASLAAVIMAAVGSMFDFGAIMEVWKLSKRDTIPMVITFVLSLIDFRIGIVVGIMGHIAMMVISQNKPQNVITEEPNKLTIIPSHGMAFPQCEPFLDDVNDALTKNENVESVVFDFKNVFTEDATSARTIAKLANKVEANDQKYLVINVSEDMRFMLDVLKIQVGETLEKEKQVQDSKFDLEVVTTEKTGLVEDEFKGSSHSLDNASGN